MKCSKLLKKPIQSSTTNDESTNNSSLISNPSTTAGDVTFLNTSFSDNDFELTRSTAKEG